MRKRYKFTYRIKVLDNTPTGNVEVPALDLFTAREQAKRILQVHYQTKGVKLFPNSIELTYLTISATDA